ncbi:family 43 glycoside hydrolase [Cryphonectria parasitica EP155]|uniref:Family 43 glycoside hydrolase n=1 Tax=Cryphonectria parasitica (strain ATCC 38755 / EP155) TaxID=660469 RepID=A0A9P5CHF6_CRYP1|nr:family 43 glycoside hydrolase [Cryphonectria parasitica EP155]KAF3759948.1 family 43 glycoside hydrolase [Cryphonectria parasitica EP155]
MPPLITHIYTADPSAHVFNGKIYIYPSHDRETDIQFNDNGDQYDMNDYHVFSLDSLETDNHEVTDHGIALKAEDVPWVSKQLWAPDAAYCAATGEYVLFFPARDKKGIFRIGIATSDKPEGPFRPEENYIPGSYSIDPAVLESKPPSAYLYFGGLWGGQLQCYQKGNDTFDEAWTGAQEPSGPGAAAMGPRVAKLSSDFRTLTAPAQEAQILDPATGQPIAADDHARRFFEAAWCHKRRGRYYFSYSTGDTHFLAYAIGDSPLGPFTYAGRILEPVLGWTTHHSVVEFPAGSDRWWLFYHDCELSGGVDHLRSVKVKEIFYDGEGRIVSEKAVV